MIHGKALTAAFAVMTGAWAAVATLPATAAEAETATRLRAAVTGDQRQAKDRARDVYRHPFETLMFVKPKN